MPSGPPQGLPRSERQQPSHEHVSIIAHVSMQLVLPPQARSQLLVHDEAQMVEFSHVRAQFSVHAEVHVAPVRQSASHPPPLQSIAQFAPS